MAIVTSSCSYPTSSFCSSYYEPYPSYKKTKKHKWTLANLDEKDKQIIYKHIRRLLFKQKVVEIMKAFNWILFAIGIGILFNFGRILSIIEMLVK